MVEETSNIQFPNLVSVVPNNGSCGFDPTNLHVESGAQVTFRNQTEHTVGLVFSNQDIFDMAYLPLLPGQAEVLSVKEGDTGEVACSVRCDINAKFAVRTVAPTIIVNRD